MPTTQQNRFTILYDPRSGGNEPESARHPQLGPLLELLCSQTRSDGIYVYHLGKAGSTLELLTWHGLQPAQFGHYEAEIGRRPSNWFPEQWSPVLIESDAWRDARFDHFPEFLRNRFETVAAVALVESGEIKGLINACRLEPGPYQPREVEFLTSLGAAIGALLARPQLADELASVQRKLADRKLVERAKGILQSRFSWTEEKAYLELRRTSRRKRVRMSQIALHVIHHAELPFHAGSAAYGD